MFLFDYYDTLSQGLLLTISVALWSLLFSCIIGFVVALAKLSHTAVIKSLASLYTFVVRGIPDLVMMLLVFYGGQIAVNAITAYYGMDYIDVDAFYAGIFTLSFIFGAFMAETFRAAILAVDVAQIEAGKAFGISRFNIIRRILIPQMLLHALPGFTNNWLVLLKATAILSVIGLHDIVFVANSASRSTHQPFVFYFIVSLVYLLLTWLSIRAIRKVEDHYHLEHQT